jgi:hypothetical protein
LRDYFAVTTAELFAQVWRQSRPPENAKSKPRQPSQTALEKPLDRANLVDHYLGLLLLVFVDAGLLDVSAVAVHIRSDGG